MDTAQKRYSAMMPMLPWRPAAIVPSGTIGGAVRQAIAFLYAGILAQAGVAIAYVADMNTRLLVYLCAYYSVSGTAADLPSLATRYMGELTGDFTDRFRQLITDATDAMS